MNMSTSYSEGNWFAVPLINGGYAVGLIARMKKGRSSKSFLGYFFGPKREKLPSAADIKKYNKANALLVARVGDLGLQKGTWPVILNDEHWDRGSWPMPYFVRTDVISGEKLKVVYDENDPGRIVSEVPITNVIGDFVEGYKDGLSGSGAIEHLLTHLLNGKE